jgi:hypothetical protein
MVRKQNEALMLPTPTLRVRVGIRALTFPRGSVRRQSAGSTKITPYVNYRIHSATLLVYGLGMIRKVGEALSVSEAATSD